MKIKVTVLVVRNTQTNEVIEAHGIKDMYSEIGIEYPTDLFTRDELETWLRYVYGPNYMIKSAHYLDEYINNVFVYISGEAKDLPSIGNVQVSVEEIEVEVL